jgi:hypothetical protein
MTSPVAGADLTPLELLARQQESIEQLAATVELLQREMEAMWRRIQDLEGVPLPEREPD